MYEIKLDYNYKAKITSVYDGDTFTAEIDLGFGVRIKEKLRLLYVDTPEVRGKERKQGLKVRDIVRDLILNKTLLIKTKKDRKGKYGRYLADIVLEVDGHNVVMLSDYLVDSKLAKRVDY